MKTLLDWSAYQDAGMGDAYADIPKQGGDFAKAVAVCINSRQCEAKTGKGVMCPSFRVTGDPALSTGGRVRLLKTALNSDEPNATAQAQSPRLDAALADPALARAMDLCVACKGCKRECENNVDMALIKSEYLAQRVQREGLSGRAWFFARLPQGLHRYRSILRALIRLRNRHRWLARLGERLLGIAAEIPLPEPSRTAFVADPPALSASSPNAVQASATTSPPLPEVVLLVDCFGRHFEPEIPAAALRLLRAAGYRVWLAKPAQSDPDPGRPLCCGRTYLAQGLVSQAADEASRLLAALLPHVHAGRWILGLEPSCLLSLRDDHLALGLGDAARQVAARSLLLEEFLAKEVMAKRLQLPFTERSESGAHSSPLVHGHCHQKAVGAMKSMRKVLKLIPGLTPQLIEAGCCGMAGTFGLEREHADLSRQMAELALLPQLRARPEATVIANGFSCRQQIRAQSAHPARHLAQVLAEALEPEAT